MATASLLTTVLTLLVGPGLGHVGGLRIQALRDTPTNFDNVLVKNELNSPVDLKSIESSHSRHDCSQTKNCTANGGTSQKKGTCPGMANVYSRKCECCFLTTDPLNSPLPSDISYFETGNTSREFIIKGFLHIINGRYIGLDKPAYPHTLLWTLHPAIASFEPVEGIWGYIRFKETGHLVVSASFGICMSVSNLTDRHSQFAIDQIHHLIIHRSGWVWSIQNPPRINILPNNKTNHKKMEAYMLSPSNPSKQILVYGKAIVIGEWELVFAVDNPLVSETYESSYTVGKSRSKSTDTTFKHGWEFSGTAKAWFAEFSASLSLSTEIQQSSSETWNEEIVETRTYEVTKGNPVAVWQRTFIGTQLGNKASFYSNIFYHTNSSKIKPPIY